ncbi:phosphoserine transaminase [Methylovirgula ligni]|uniref:phosphoserine transaminase n=1 Tax=Methylovirgula ligni TaxID=569860 RepID=A0A3D9YYM4_9HYPH|nr:phosphoserine transaminase [Methylovirgula ligni]QAY94356.1 phosphoserine transaminase [Methylovirgula ligni]REF87802.1 phosphoserine aminotransferase [Methylovirgula ligni]
MSSPPRQPRIKPARPFFSSGPCPKRPGWTVDVLKGALVGRSHRSPAGVAKLRQAIDLTREVLEIPPDYRIAIVPASDTGAVEMALWSLLGARGVDVFAWDAFGETWAVDAEALKLSGLRLFRAPPGEIADLAKADPDHDIVFTWNGTSTGVRVPNADWIAADRTGLTICDATSAAFAQKLDWPKLDVVTFSWQKGLGSEAAHGMLVLSPRAVERLETYRPAWPLPKIFQLTHDGKLDEALFKGWTINTPSLLCVEDYLDALGWAKSLGGLDALIARADANARTLGAWVETTDWIDFLVEDPAIRSNTSLCLELAEPEVAQLPAAERKALVDELLEVLEEAEVAYDIGAYRQSPPGLRIWCGPTVDAPDLPLLTAWLDYAYGLAR